MQLHRANVISAKAADSWKTLITQMKRFVDAFNQEVSGTPDLRVEFVPVESNVVVIRNCRPSISLHCMYEVSKRCISVEYQSKTLLPTGHLGACLKFIVDDQDDLYLDLIVDTKTVKTGNLLDISQALLTPIFVGEKPPFIAD